MNYEHVLIDLDGVLADFVGGALAVHNKPELAESWPRGVWDIAKLIGVSTSELWSKIDETEAKTGFWSELDPYPWLEELLGIVTQGGSVPFTIATSPSSDPACAASKVRWMRKHLGSQFKDYLIGSAKHLMARPGTILLDDYDRNVDAFRQAGGQAILFPQPWNTAWDKTEDRLGEVARHTTPASGE